MIERDGIQISSSEENGERAYIPIRSGEDEAERGLRRCSWGDGYIERRDFGKVIQIMGWLVSKGKVFV